MKIKWLVVVVVSIAALFGIVGGWYWRTQTVVWAIAHPSLQPMLSSMGSNLAVRPLQPWYAPWDQPDLVLRWVDPWGSDKQHPFIRPISGPPPQELVAYEVFGLLSARGAVAPADFTKWASDLDTRVPGTEPLAVSGKSDSDLLTLFLWFGEGVMGPENLQASLMTLTLDPKASIDSSGSLVSGHPWASTLEEIKRWSNSGRLVANWWDYSEIDVVDAVTTGKARWGLGWSGAHFASEENGVPTSSLQLAPAWPGRRSTSLVGRWLTLENSNGWGDPVTVGESKARLWSAVVGQQWLKQGLLMADVNLPAVNQETKALSLGLLSAGALISAPTSSTDLFRWHPLLEAMRTELRR